MPSQQGEENQALAKTTREFENQLQERSSSNLKDSQDAERQTSTSYDYFYVYLPFLTAQLHENFPQNWHTTLKSKRDLI